MSAPAPPGVAPRPQPSAFRRKWAIVVTSGVLTGLGHGFVQTGVSALLKPVAADLDMSRAGVSSAIALGRLVGGIMSFVSGHSVDRWGSRRVVLAGTILLALGCLLVSGVTSPAGLFIAWGIVVSAGTSMAFTVAMDRTVVANVDTGRGFALAVRFVVVALVTTAQLPLIVWLISDLGWRTACAIWSAVLLLTLPLTHALFEDGLPVTKGEGEADRTVPLRQALRQRSYWILAFAYMATATTISALSVHSIPMLTDRGWTLSGAGLIVGTLILFSIPARLMTGLFADRLPSVTLARILGVTLLFLGGAVLTDAWVQSDASLVAMMLAKGVASGVPTVMILVISVAQFGRASVGAIQGSLMFLQVPGTMAGPVLLGWTHDVSGTYAPALVGVAVLLLGAGLTLQFMRDRTDIR